MFDLVTFQVFQGHTIKVIPEHIVSLYAISDNNTKISFVDGTHATVVGNIEEVEQKLRHTAINKPLKRPFFGTIAEVYSGKDIPPRTDPTTGDPVYAEDVINDAMDLARRFRDWHGTKKADEQYASLTEYLNALKASVVAGGLRLPITDQGYTIVEANVLLKLGIPMTMDKEKATLLKAAHKCISAMLHPHPRVLDFGESYDPQPDMQLIEHRQTKVKQLESMARFDANLSVSRMRAYLQDMFGDKLQEQSDEMLTPELKSPTNNQDDQPATPTRTPYNGPLHGSR